MLTSTALVLMMTDPRPRAVLRRPGAHQEHAVGADAGVRDHLADRGAVDASTATALAFTGRRERVLRRLRSKLFLQGLRSTAIRDRRDLLPRASTFPNWSSCAFQMTFAAITPALIVGAFAERMKFSALLLFMVLWFTFVYLPIAHMVWLGGPDASPTAGSSTRRRLAVAEGRARLRRRHRRAHQRRHRRPGRLPACSASASAIGNDRDAAAQPDAHGDRRLPAVGRLVRLQRRFRARGERHCRAGVHQHLARHRRRGPGLDVRRVVVKGKPSMLGAAPAPSPASSRSRRLRVSSASWARSSSAWSPASSACGASTV